MTDLDKMARELLAAEYDRAGSKRFAEDLRSDCHIGDRDIAHAVGAIRAALMTAPPGWKLVPVDEKQWTDAMRDAGRAAVMAARCASPTWTPRQHYDASGRSVAGIPEDVLDERGPLTKESTAVMVMAAMIAAAPEPEA